MNGIWQIDYYFVCPLQLPFPHETCRLMHELFEHEMITFIYWIYDFFPTAYNMGATWRVSSLNIIALKKVSLRCHTWWASYTWEKKTQFKLSKPMLSREESNTLWNGP